MDGVGTLVDIAVSGEGWLSTTTPGVQFAALWDMRKLDGLLFRLESEGRSRMLLSATVGVDGGVENVSVSGIGENTACISNAEANTITD